MPSANRAVSDQRSRIVVNVGATGRGIPIQSGNLGEFQFGESQFGGGTEYVVGTRRVILNNEE